LTNRTLSSRLVFAFPCFFFFAGGGDFFKIEWAENGLGRASSKEEAIGIQNTNWFLAIHFFTKEWRGSNAYVLAPTLPALAHPAREGQGESRAGIPANL